MPPLGIPAMGNDLHEPESNGSIFSQLLEKIVQGYGPGVFAPGDDGTSFEILFESCPNSVLILSHEGEILEANPAFFSTFRYSRKNLEHKSIFHLIPEKSQKLFKEKIFDLNFRTEEEKSSIADDILPFEGIRSDGTIQAMDCLLSAYSTAQGLVIVVVIRDLTFDREMYKYLQETREHYSTLTEAITEAIFRIDEDFKILFANSGVKTTFGYEKGEVLGKHFGMLFPDGVFKQHEEIFRKYFVVDDPDRNQVGLKRTFELLGNRKNRGVSLMEMSFGNSKEQKGRTMTCIIRDITQRKLLERKFRYLAFHDKLTGLGNRELFNEDLQNHLGDLAKVKNQGPKCSVFFLDLDGFKNINDTLGHDAGDYILVETARRLRVCLRDSDFAYRFGGDEFVLLLSKIGHLSDSTVIAGRILNAIMQPYEIEIYEGCNVSVSVGVSIGIAIVPDHGNTVAAATKSADIAMYCSKESGKNRYTVFDESLNTRAIEDWQIEQAMKSALINGQFSLYYQPIVDSSGYIRGAEALIRWQLPDGSFVPPSKFIPIAEKNEMINTIGSWVLRRGFSETKLLHKLGVSDFFISVNLSGKQFNQDDFVENIVRIIGKSGVDPRSVKLELTETAIMNYPEDAARKLLEIKDKLPGIRFMIDDFGTGYSSLSHLSRFPVDSLKIDLSFVKNLAEKQNEKIVNAIINLAHGLDLGIVAEGIETKDQWDYFKARNVENFQGFFFMEAVTVKELFGALGRQGASGQPYLAQVRAAEDQVSLSV